MLAAAAFDGDDLVLGAIVERNALFAALGIESIRYLPGTWMTLRDGRIARTPAAACSNGPEDSRPERTLAGVRPPYRRSSPRSRPVPSAAMDCGALAARLDCRSRSNVSGLDPVPAADSTRRGFRR